MKPLCNDFFELVLHAIEAVHSLQENEIALIGKDEAVTIRAVQVVAALNHIAMKIDAKPLSRGSKLRLAVVKSRCNQFQDSSRKCNVASRMGSLAQLYRDALDSGKSFCEMAAPHSIEAYSSAFGA